MKNKLFEQKIQAFLSGKLSFFQGGKQKVQKKRKYFFFLLLLLFLAFPVYFLGTEYGLFAKAEETYQLNQEENMSRVQRTQGKRENFEEKDRNREKKPGTSEHKITVCIQGAVLYPGLYSLASGDCLAALIDAAGGLTKEAWVEELNLAEELEDHQLYKIEKTSQVTSLLENEKVGREACFGKKVEPRVQKKKKERVRSVSINHASIQEFCQLPGIGPSTAQKIIEYRKKHGRFHKKEELLQVPGIKKSKYEKIQTFIQCN